MTKDELIEEFEKDMDYAQNRYSPVREMIEKGWTKEKRKPQVGDVWEVDYCNKFIVFVMALGEDFICLPLDHKYGSSYAALKMKCYHFVKFIGNYDGKSIAEIVREVGL